jgi:hypothetical protein
LGFGADRLTALFTSSSRIPGCLFETQGPRSIPSLEACLPETAVWCVVLFDTVRLRASGLRPKKKRTANVRAQKKLSAMLPIRGRGPLHAVSGGPHSLPVGAEDIRAAYPADAPGRRARGRTDRDGALEDTAERGSCAPGAAPGAAIRCTLRGVRIRSKRLRAAR